MLFARATPSADWEHYLKQISEDYMTMASNSYKESGEERADVLKAFIASRGSITHILHNVPFMRREDEMRIIRMLQEAMTAKKFHASK